MRMFEAWRRHRLSNRPACDRAERLAFQAGARHAMNELVEHLEGTQEAATTAYRLNDEIRDFGRVALQP